MKRLETLLTQAFVGLGVTLSAFFGVLALVVFLKVEDYLVRDQLTAVLARDEASMEMPFLRATTRLADLPESIRAWASELAPGLHEREDDGWETHVLVTETADGHAFAFRRRPESEARERVLTAAILGAVALTSIIGWLMARRLSSAIGGPITALAARLEARDEPARLERGEAPYRELGVLVDALIQSTRQAKEALLRERRFVHDVSHELRTPLTVIGGACELLDEEGVEARVAPRIDRIRRSADTAKDTVEALLALARREVEWEHRSRDPAAETDIASTLRELESLARPGVNFTIRVRDEPCIRSADEPLFRIAVSNLARNALEATTRGRVEVEIEGDRARVTDTGPGLPDTIREGASGSPPGIGLAMVRRICARCGWRLTFASRGEEGTVAILGLEPGRPDPVTVHGASPPKIPS